MSFWINFWTAVLVIGLGAYFLVALVVIPLGALDIKRMFARLDAAQADQKTQPRKTKAKKARKR